MAEQQSVFGPRGEHPVWLIGILGDEVIDEYADVGLRAIQNKWRTFSDFEDSIDPSY